MEFYCFKLALYYDYSSEMLWHIRNILSSEINDRISSYPSQFPRNNFWSFPTKDSESNKLCFTSTKDHRPTFVIACGNNNWQSIRRQLDSKYKGDQQFSDCPTQGLSLYIVIYVDSYARKVLMA